MCCILINNISPYELQRAITTQTEGCDFNRIAKQNQIKGYSNVQKSHSLINMISTCLTHVFRKCSFNIRIIERTGATMILLFESFLINSMCQANMPYDHSIMYNTS